MKNFKAGDKVVRTGDDRYGVEKGLEYEVGQVMQNGDILLVGHGGAYSESLFNFVPSYPNPPHKHADLIIAWAKGAVIQVRVGNTSRWSDIKQPCWDEFNVYRIKPTKSKQELEIENIQVEIDILQERINDVKKGDY